MVVVVFAPDEEEEDLLWLPLPQAFAAGSGEVGMMLEAIMFFLLLFLLCSFALCLCLFYFRARIGWRGASMVCLV